MVIFSTAWCFMKTEWWKEYRRLTWHRNLTELKLENIISNAIRFTLLTVDKGSGNGFHNNVIRVHEVEHDIAEGLLASAQHLDGHGGRTDGQTTSHRTSVPPSGWLIGPATLFPVRNGHASAVRTSPLPLCGRTQDSCFRYWWWSCGFCYRTGWVHFSIIHWGWSVPIASELEGTSLNTMIWATI